ncbi:MAG: hypothetical protein GTN90_14340, partial [Xanthomonadales bacterium]|nr:hypothetical protein [Xanthomonadales bacterium]
MPTHSSCLPNHTAVRLVPRLLAGTGLALFVAGSAVADPAGLVAEANRLLGLARSELVRLDPGPDAAQQLRVSIPVNGVADELILARHSVRAPQHRVLAQVADGSYVE